MFTTRSALTTLAIAAVSVGAAAPAVAAAGQHATHLSHLSAPARSPVTIDGPEAGKPLLKKGKALPKGYSLLRVKVITPAEKGLDVRFTCVKGFIGGYGYAGPDSMAINGHPLTNQHSIKASVKAADDRDDDGAFTGTVYALCQG